MDRLSNILKERLEATQPARPAHPSSDTLVAFVEQGLSGSPRENVLAHLAVCPECREAVALATPEAATVNTQAATHALSSALHFPTAMRWASLAAALAVGVGVGVIAYEHEAPMPQQATVKEAQPAEHPAPSSAPVANEEVSSNRQASTAKSSPHAQSHSSLAEKQEASRGRTLEKKPAEAAGAILGRISGSLPDAPSKDRYEEHLKTLPSPVPEAQAELANKRDGIPQMRAAPAALSQSVSVTADNKAAQEVNANVSATKPGAASADGAPVGGLAREDLVQNQPVPPKAVNAVAFSGPPAKTKRAYGMFAFVHWTISAAGKLQRRATDGTLTIVEPVPGAIVRAVAAEGIEVWAGGAQPAPRDDVQVRSMLFHSSDAGETWTSIEGPWQGPITRVNLAGLGSLTVIAADGTWSTGDGGKSWSKQ